MRGARGARAEAGFGHALESIKIKENYVYYPSLHFKGQGRAKGAIRAREAGEGEGKNLLKLLNYSITFQGARRARGAMARGARGARERGGRGQRRWFGHALEPLF